MGTFTGKHMAATMVGGFGIVIAVNFYMASLATIPMLRARNITAGSRKRGSRRRRAGTLRCRGARMVWWW